MKSIHLLHNNITQKKGPGIFIPICFYTLHVRYTRGTRVAFTMNSLFVFSLIRFDGTSANSRMMADPYPADKVLLNMFIIGLYC